MNKGNGLKYLKQLVIRHGDDYQKPSVVYIRGFSEVMNNVICEIVNTNVSCFGGWFEPYDINRLNELLVIWKIENNEREYEWLQKELINLV